MRALVYHPPRALTVEQQDALVRAWSRIACQAEAAKRAELPLTARGLAENARRLVAAFGVRWDNRARSPFPHQPRSVRAV